MSNMTTNLGSVADTQNSEEFDNATTYSHKIMDSYPEYGLTAERIIRNNYETNFQMIVKDNQPVATFTKGYKVIPNEVVKDLVSEIAENHHLVKGSELGSEAGVMGGLADNLYGYKFGVETAITSILVAPEPINLNAGTKLEPDNIRFGVAIGNSIDGTQSLKAFGFSFRQLCSNMAYHFKRGASMQVASEDAIANPRFNKTEIVASTSFVHRRSLNIEDFSDSVGHVLNYSTEFFKQLQAMRTQKIQKVQAQKIAKLPKTVTDKLDWLGIDKLGNVNLRKEPSQYQAWNDLTDILSHDKKIGYNGRLRYFNTVDAILVRTA